MGTRSSLIRSGLLLLTFVPQLAITFAPAHSLQSLGGRKIGTFRSYTRRPAALLQEPVMAGPTTLKGEQELRTLNSNFDICQATIWSLLDCMGSIDLNM